jgi:hypothetical protein
MTGATVCAMCGDVGFPDKLFPCARCRRRYQHSYVRSPAEPYYPIRLNPELAPFPLPAGSTNRFRSFRCMRVRARSYCTNYYGDAAPAEAGAGVCDWCLSDEVGSGKKRPHNSSASSGCSKQQQQEAAAQARSSEQPPPFPPSGCGKGAGKGGEHEGGRRARRYKLLKDVLC